MKEGGGGLDSLRRQYSQPLYVLLTLVGLILALACANVANLLLARAAARRREMALRLSIGAGRFRVVRQLLTESVLLASLGGVLGLLFAIWGIRFLTVLLANGRANFTLHAELNWHVLGVAAALSVLTGVLFGLAPALQATRVDVIAALKTTRASQPRAARVFRRIGLSHLLVVSQIAISLVLLVAAGLFVRTLSNLRIGRPRLQSRERAAVPVGRPEGRTPGPGDCRLLRRPAKTVRRDPRRTQREPVARFAHRRGDWTAHRRGRRAAPVRRLAS